MWLILISIASALDEEKSVQDNVSGGRDMLEIGGKPKHVISYLQDFLFAPERCRQPVKALSGGGDAIGFYWPSYSLNRPMCWYSTNRPMIWT